MSFKSAKGTIPRRQTAKKLPHSLRRGSGSVLREFLKCALLLVAASAIAQQPGPQDMPQEMISVDRAGQEALHLLGLEDGHRILGAVVLQGVPG